jgi:hypothetical protein
VTSHCVPSSGDGARIVVGCSRSAMDVASDVAYRADPGSKKMRVDQRYAHSAYRLRREWLGGE